MIQITHKVMLTISYTISPRLNEYLGQIEELRRQILLTPIPPAKEQRLKWEATFNRIHSSLKLTGNPIERSEMLKLLSEVTHKKMNSEQEIVLKYKEALFHISQNWQGSENPVDAKAIIGLHRIIGTGRLRIPEAGLQHLLDYLQSKSENPVIKAAIINIELEKMQLFTEQNILIAHLASDIFLYKYGYDFKGFLAYEKNWTEDSNSPLGFKQNHEMALRTVGLTLWLEFFALNILQELNSIVQLIDKPKSTTVDLKESFWKLNERQKSILGFLDSPLVTITNRQIQKRYKTSQITASRDLAKLSNLGYLFSHGKGRSVYYTKI